MINKLSQPHGLFDLWSERRPPRIIITTVICPTLEWSSLDALSTTLRDTLGDAQQEVIITGRGDVC